MISIIRTLVPENGMEFEEICSFETNSFIGIWDHSYDEWILIAKEEAHFESSRIGYVSNLDELDEEVHSTCGEHIEGVSCHNAYKIILTASC